MVKRDWIVRYKELPPVPDRLMTLQSWDTAQQGRPGERLVGLHEIDSGASQAVVSRRRLAAPRRLSRPLKTAVQTLCQTMERPARFGRGRRRRDLSCSGVERAGLGGYRR